MKLRLSLGSYPIPGFECIDPKPATLPDWLLRRGEKPTAPQPSLRPEDGLGYPDGSIEAVVIDDYEPIDAKLLAECWRVLVGAGGTLRLRLTRTESNYDTDALDRLLHDAGFNEALRPAPNVTQCSTLVGWKDAFAEKSIIIEAVKW